MLLFVLAARSASLCKRMSDFNKSQLSLFQAKETILCVNISKGDITFKKENACNAHQLT